MNQFKIRSSAVRLLVIALTATTLLSCQEETPGGKTDPQAPVISFTNTAGIYTVKVGKEITITPTVENDTDAVYTWKANGKILGTKKELTYTWETSGQVYVTYTVFNDYGSDQKEIRVDVAELVPPTIALGVPQDGFVILVGQELALTPEVDNRDEATYTWTVDGKEVSRERNYTFQSDKSGSFVLSLTTTNEDGEDSIEFGVEVKNPADMPFSWSFETTEYNIAKGRTIALTPQSITNAFDATYTWSIDSKEVQRSKEPLYIFTGEKEGVFAVTVTMKNGYNERTQTLTVTVSATEGKFKRPITESSKANWNKVYEFLPAPGQFVNEYYTANTMAEAIAYAESQLSQNFYVSLGGFGGYIVVGFDHSIENDGSYNFRIEGNSFQGSSEPGIVWVMQDENGDGKPNDTWYELKGSEYGKPETIQNYEITYYRPRSVQMPVSWRDNQGKSGTVDYLAAYHRQDYYYPLWVEGDSYTLRGTCLKSRTREVTPGYWSNDEFGWGYADNFSPTDRLTDDDNHNAGVNGNHFKISDAVTFDGKPANLQYIDFVKVQTGVNAKAGWLGEVSVELFGAADYNMLKKK